MMELIDLKTMANRVILKEIEGIDQEASIAYNIQGDHIVIYLNGPEDYEVIKLWMLELFVKDFLKDSILDRIKSWGQGSSSKED